MALAAASVPPIVASRFGLEQRCFYRHPDLYEEEVPEMELETVLSRPDLGAGCAFRSFLLLGDQNAGKSTLLHSFCREGDPSFMQLSSLLPVLSSSFINTRLVPRSLFGDREDDLNKCISAVRDEMPFMDTDIARGIVMLIRRNFVFFCNEFGVSIHGEEEDASGEGPAAEPFGPEVRFVALQFVELGGDHLDRLLRFGASGGDLGALRASEAVGVDPTRGSAEDEAFWTDIHEVLLGSLRLLRATSSALRSMLRKLSFLGGALGSGCGGGGGGLGGTCEVVFYVSRAPPVEAGSFDAAAAWAEARAEVLAFARDELGASAAASAARTLLKAPPPSVGVWEPCDEGLDLSALEEVAGAAALEWRAAEERSGPLLAFIRDMVASLALPALRSRLRLCGVYAARSLVDELGDARSAAPGPRVSAGLAPSMEGQGSLCAPSVVRNVARLLRRAGREDLGAVGPGHGLVPHVAELMLRCSLRLRQVESPGGGANTATVVGRWVTRFDLAEHLEECEAELSVPLPEVATLQCWEAAVLALDRAAVCSLLAPGGEKGAIEVLTVALVVHGPISVSIEASRMDFYYYASGIYDNPACSSSEAASDHVVLAVGYGRGALPGQTYWLLRNSWSSYWGEGGYVRVAREGNICGVATTPAFALLNPHARLP
ncbi:unnamed protein product [Prorocentrum cordatum]|uniref:Peptidase C1A papain C-terminal domain-containing protein n=1 Tax=Prorocentrum cordatum TaxID=2364126 RepID=A0ABN9WNJ1_9DINO|nr:unnamed protein product [Polarella glacialis]